MRLMYNEYKFDVSYNGTNLDIILYETETNNRSYGYSSNIAHDYNERVYHTTKYEFIHKAIINRTIKYIEYIYSNLIKLQLYNNDNESQVVVVYLIERDTEFIKLKEFAENNRDKYNEWYISKYKSKSDLIKSENTAIFLYNNDLYKDLIGYLKNVSIKTEILGELLEKSCIDNNLEVLKFILINNSKQINAEYNNNILIRTACEKEHLEIVKFLLSGNNSQLISNTLEHYKNKMVNITVDPSISPEPGNEPIIISCTTNNTEIFKLLLKHPKVDPSAFNDECIKIACFNGNVEMVKLLLEDIRVDPKGQIIGGIITGSMKNEFNHSYKPEIIKLLINDFRMNSNNISGLLNACYTGNQKIVERILTDPEYKQIDPSDHSNNALNIACEKGYLEIVKMLLNHDKVKEKLLTDIQVGNVKLNEIINLTNVNIRTDIEKIMKNILFDFYF